MEYIAEFRNSKLFDKRIIMKDFNFVIAPFLNIALIGCGASGKSVIIKAFNNEIKSTNMFVEGKRPKLQTLYNNFAVLTNQNQFLADTVYEELSFYLENVAETNLKEKIIKILKIFKLEKHINSNLNILNKEEKILIKIISFLIKRPKILAIDNLFLFLQEINKKKIIKYAKEKNIVILLATSDIEDTLFFDKICIVHNRQIIAYEDTDKILKQERLLNKIGYGLPLITDLSTQLQFYGLITKNYKDEQELIGDLWK